MLNLSSKRLALYCLTLEQLETGLVSIRTLAGSIGVPIVSRLFEGVVERAVRMKVEKMTATARDTHPWFTYWLIVLKEEKIGAGLVGFKGLPNDKGEVEIGYGLDEHFQRRGYMTEAVCTLNGWAFSHPEVKTITATHVSATNFASQKVLVKCGFIEVSSDTEFINYTLPRRSWNP